MHQSMARPQVLVQWSQLPALLATWEDELQLRSCFPASPAWGQGEVEGRDNVMPIGTTTPVTLNTNMDLGVTSD
jgi:hypothetical protein